MSSRSLDSNSLFQLASTTVTTGTRMFVNSLARESYPITYVYGFSSEGFSYFVSVQKQAVEESAPYISKLIRLCHNDQHYYSHTEVPLDCSDNNSSYNLVQAAYLGKPGSELAGNLGISVNDDVLFAVFSKSHWENNLKPNTQSALCIYSLELIRNLFTENIKDCYLGKVDRGLDFINPSVKCQNTLIPINHNFCGTDVNTPLGGKKPIKATAIIVYPYETLTSVASVPTHDYTVVFLGTSNGDLKKVVVESATRAIEYGNLTINKESPVDADLFFDRNQTFLYVMTERKVSKVQVQECGKFNTCTECLGSKDPYCGWCSLENKCKLRSECATVERSDPLYWLSYRSGKCTLISNVEPRQIQRTTARKLNLTIENLPSLLGQFLCVFTVFGKTMITNATRSIHGVSCPTPRTDELPAILPGEHHFVARLSVRIKVEPEFVATNFTFYDCNSYTSCTSCVSSPFPCDWCVEGHRCTHNTGEYCRKDYLITGISSIGSSIKSGPSFCPRINSTSKEILVSSGMFHNVTVQAINIQPFQARFQCQFNMEGRIKHANAQLSGETITCESYQFSYASFSPNSTATFAVLWSGNKPLDNPDFIHLTIYKCAAMASNCGLCLELDPKFNCGWCESMCYVKSQCTPRTWLNRSATCPDPQITQFYPMTGPWEGGTELTIEGINLGKIFDDIKNGVRVASIPCEPMEEHYERTSKIVCRTDTIGNNDPMSEKVVVKVNDYEGQSAFKFTYVDPKIRDISPTKGPKSGGTKVTISGEYMNAGSNITASIGGNPCRIFSKFTTEVVCITSWSAFSQNGSVVMQFDRGRRFFTGKLFYYSEDPTIVRVSSSASFNRDGPKGIPSGGTLIFVEGTNLDSVQEPKMAVSRQGKSYESQCEVLSPIEMRCRAPILAGAIISSSEYPVELDYGFIMDNITSLRNLTTSKFKSYILYQDPIYKSFTEKDQIKYYKSDYLTINGENLDGGCKELDVIVQIGTGICNVTSLSSKQLTCRPPPNQPAALDEKNIPLVVVIVGSNLNYTIGYLSYATPTIFEGGLPKPIIIGITVGGGILLIIVVIILIAYRRKSTESSRVLKNMQEQMDVLELRVASECKEAFAELQTEMTDFTNDLSASGIPFLDYRSYSMKVLFPNVEDHPVLRETLEVDPIKKIHT